MEEDLEAAGLLRDVAQAILAAFAALDRRFERDGVEGREDLHNCKGRFLIWTDGLAVVEGELDKCLESHEAIRECVSALMGDLGLVLTTILRSSQSSTTDLKERSHAATLDMWLERLSHTSHEFRDYYESFTDSSYDLKWDDALEQVQDTIDALFDLIVPIEELQAVQLPVEEQPARAKIVLENSASSRRVGFFDHILRDKYPHAQEFLIKRLADANWQRFEALRLTNVAQENAVAALPKSSQANAIISKTPADMKTNTASKVSGTASRVFTGRGEDFTSAGTPSSVLSAQEPAAKHSGEKASPSPSRMLGTPRLSSQSIHTTETASSLDRSQEGENRKALPPPPIALGSQPIFRCSICKLDVANITSKKLWRAHVFHDLRPYVCTYPECSEADYLYTTRRACIQHELEAHRVIRQWKCVCNDVFPTAAAYQAHVTSSHGPALQQQLTSQLSSREVKSYQLEDLAQCPLCGDEIEPSRNTISRHLGRHMESVALLVIPRAADDEYWVDDSSEGSEPDTEDIESKFGRLGSSLESVEVTFDPEMDRIRSTWHSKKVQLEPRQYKLKTESLNLSALGDDPFALLCIISLLNIDTIPESMFIEYVLDLQRAPKSTLITDKSRYFQARDELWRESLIGVTDSTLNTTRVTQDATRALMDTEQFQDAFETAIQLLIKAWPSDRRVQSHPIADWPKCDMLFPHIDRLHDHFAAYQRVQGLPPTMHLARLFAYCGWYDHEQGNSSHCKRFFYSAQRIYDESRDTGEPEDQDLYWDIHRSQGVLAFETNDAIACLTHHKLLLDATKRRFPSPVSQEERVPLAICCNQLGIGMMMNNRVYEAIEHFELGRRWSEQFVNDSEDALAVFSLSTANLAFALWIRKAEGDNENASTIVESAVTLRATYFGTGNDTAFILGRLWHAMGNIRRSQDMTQEAFSCHQKAYRHYLHHFGNMYRRTADLAHIMAGHALQARDDAQALEYIEKALDVYVSKVWLKPERARALYRKAVALAQLDEARSKECHREAVRLYRQVLSQRRQHLPSASRPEEEDYDNLVIFWTR